MILLPVTLAVLAMTAVGLVLFHRLVGLLAPAASPPPARDLLLLGVLPGLALTGFVLTVLALAHLLLGWLLLLLAAATLIVLRRDSLAVAGLLAAAACEILLAARRGNLFPLLAAIAFVVVAALGLSLALVPGTNVDIWVFHVPLARSIAAHHGLVFPQIGHIFYGSQPLLFELMAGVVMLAADHFAAAGAVNLAIYLGLLLLLLAFVPRGRGLAFLLLCLGLVWLGPFFVQAAQPMIDVPRACFSVAAFLFAWRYACDFRRLDLALSGLLAGAAVAGKYTELLTPLLIGAVLAPLIARRHAWRDLTPALCLFTAISALWYVKNLFLFGNPVYPFLLGHPGLSDEWMRGYMTELTQSAPADRAFSRDLLTLRGWHDFAIAWSVKFRELVPAVLAMLAGLATSLPRRWMLPLWSALLFVIWYLLMFNSRRWAAPASLLTISSAFLTMVWLANRVWVRWETSASPRLRHATRLAASLAAVLAFVAAAFLAVTGRGEILMPRWRIAVLCDGSTLAPRAVPCEKTTGQA